MIEGRILIADHHETIQNDHVQIVSILDSSSNHSLEKLSFFKHVQIKGGQHYNFHASLSCLCLIIPITGAVAIGEVAIDVEQAHYFEILEGNPVKIQNLFDQDTISFLLIGFSTTGSVAQNHFFNFNMNLRNQMQLIGNHPLIPKVSIGFFDGRAETVIKTQDLIHFFAFVIAGAFELSGRLLHQLDGLLLSNVQEIEMEALSNHAAIVTIAAIN